MILSPHTISAASQGNPLRLKSSYHPTRPRSPGAVRAAVVQAVKEDARDLVANRNEPLARVLRPQAANQWSMLPYLGSITPQWLEGILRNALMGAHLYAWQLFDLMLDSDPTIASCAMEFVEGIQRKKLIISPAHEEDEEPEDEAMARQKVVSAVFRNFNPNAAAAENGFRGLLRDLAFCRFYGTNVLEIDYHESNGGDESVETEVRRLMVDGVGEIIAPRTANWVHPACYGWQNGYCGLLPDMVGGAYRDLSRRDPSAKYALTRERIYDPWSQNAYTQIIPFEPNKFLIANFKARSGSIFGGSILRPLAWYWCMTNFSVDWLANQAQMWQLPWRIGKYAPGTDSDSLSILDNMMQNAGSNPWLRIPEGTSVELLFGPGGTSQSPAAYLAELCDRKKREVILRQTMSGTSGTMGKGGGQAFGAVEAQVKDDAIDAGAEEVAEVLQTQFARAILNVNYGDDQFLPEIRLTDKATYGSEEATTVSTLVACGLEFSKDELRKKFDWQKPRDEEDTLKKAEPAPLPTPGSPAAPFVKREQQNEPPAPEDDPEKETDAARSLDAAQSAGAADAASRVAALLGSRLKPVLIAARAIATSKMSDEEKHAALKELLALEEEITAELKTDPALSQSLAQELGKTFVAALQSSRRDPALEAGDVPGHEFHGNQWTEGEAEYNRARADFTALREKGAKALPEYEKTFSDFAAKHGATLKVANLKGEERGVAKILSDYKGDSSRLKDVVRGTIIARDEAHAHEISAALEKKFDTSHGGKRDLWAPGAKSFHSTGYRDAKYNVKIGDLVTEVQVSTPAMLAAKHEAHPLMKQMAAIQRKGISENRRLTESEKAEMRSLLAQQQQIYGFKKGATS